MNGITACIWDMDHTLYETDELDVPGHADALIILLRKHGVDAATISDTEIKETMASEYRRVGTSYRYFSDRFGISIATIADGIAAYAIPDVITRSEALPGLFAACPRTHVINTHSTRVWAGKLLPHLRLDTVFGPDRIVFHADHGMASKAKSPATHEAALAITGKSAANVVMIDDAHANLRIPKEMGMKTILIGRERTADTPAYVDAVVARATDVFTLLA